MRLQQKMINIDFSPIVAEDNIVGYVYIELIGISKKGR